MPPTVSRRILLLVAATALALGIPLGVALASHQFSDVPTSNPFHTDISAVADSGVTTGCGGTKFCPKDVVTREQMAAFLNRLGALQQGRPPVVNAAEVESFRAGELNRVAFASSGNLINGDTAAVGSLAVNIAAPRAGFLMIWGQGAIYLEEPSGADEVTCFLEVNDTFVPGTQRFSDVNFDASYDNDDDVCASSGGYQVCSPGTYRVEYAVSGVSTATDVDDATLMVEYVPFNANGVAPSASCLSGGGGGPEERAPKPEG
jgi:hypothetical protein